MRRSALGRVEGSKLDRELVLPRLAVADELAGAADEVLLGGAQALGEGRRHGAVDDLHARPRRLVHLDPIQPDALLRTARADRPHLTRRQRIGADLLVALDLRRRDEVLDAVFADPVAELRVAELRASDPLLLLLHSPPALEREPHRPLEVLVRDRHLRVRVEQLEQPVDRPVDGVDVAPAQGGPEQHDGRAPATAACATEAGSSTRR